MPTIPLPPVEQEVTSSPYIKPYWAPQRSQSEYVKALLQLNLNDIRYLRNRHGTRCNWLVHDALRVCGVELPRVNGWPMLANVMHDHFTNPTSGFTVCNHDEAIMAANMGLPTVAFMKGEPNGHVAMVLPSDPRIMLIMQAGARNFYGRPVEYGFGHTDKVKFASHP